MKRSKFSLSHYKLLTADMGYLVPIAWYEALPGDTIQQATSMLVRVSPLLAPVMHPVHVRIHHWFVPNRLLWDDWEDFITGGPDGMNNDAPPFASVTDVAVGGLADYMGVPPATPGDISTLPFRAYNLIWNEWYRDQDLQAELEVPKTGGEDPAPYQLQQVCWEKDYFTSARPWTQKGPEVNIPLTGSAPVVPVAPGEFSFKIGGAGAALALRGTNGSNDVTYSANAASTDTARWNTTALEANLAGVNAVNINDLRTAFALQRYEEARARYGSRYTEYLRYLGVKSSDARLQRPEYLGGGKQTIQFSEVLQTGPDGSDEGVANLKGHGIGAVRSNRFRRFFEEHGIVMSLMSVKPKTMYAQGIARQFSRQTKEEYFQRELQHVGQQAIYNREIYGPHTNPEGIFGYQDRYDEYRRCESGIAGEFRNLLDYWHYARVFATEPALNADFVKATPTKRVNAEQTQHCLWIMANHSIQARRMVSKTGKSFIF